MRQMFLLAAFLILLPDSLWAGAAVARQQQMQAMRDQAEQQAVAQYQQAQAQAQAEAYKQAVMQQQAEMVAYQQQMIMQQMVQQRINEEISAYVQAKMINQAQEQAVKQITEQLLVQQLVQGQVKQIQERMIYQAVAEAVQQAAVANAVNQQQAGMVANVVAGQRNQAALEAYARAQQQVVATRYGEATAQVQNQAIAQAVQERQAMAVGQNIVDIAAQQKMNALRNQAMANNVAHQGLYAAAVAKQLGQEVAANVEQPFEQISSDQVKDVVDIADVWNRLDKSSVAWALLIDNQAKVMTVEEYIERYRKGGVKISQGAPYYAEAIDAMSQANPSMLERPFKELLQMVAILDYDFDAGVDRDVLARKMLGNGEQYHANRKRLGR